jgi:hypothetical protein
VLCMISFFFCVAETSVEEALLERMDLNSREIVFECGSTVLYSCS